MNQAEVEAFIEGLENVEREENFGYIFYFVGADHRLPFVTIGQADNDYDKLSQLDREGVFRVNIGVSKASYAAIIGATQPSEVDYAVLNVFIPHPDHARQHYLCILNPIGDNAATTRQLIMEAHGITARLRGGL